MKILICPLVSRDLKKAIRATKTASGLFPCDDITFDTVSIINSKNKQFIQEFSSWCDHNNYKYQITESNGTPSKGKNACLDYFKTTDFDGLCMLDGDDVFYPTSSLQLSRHLNHHPKTDVLIVKPSDNISNDPNGNVQFNNTTFGLLWGTHHVTLDYNCGVGKNEVFEQRHKASNLGGHVFYSRKASAFIKYDETQLLGEDLLLEFEMLKLHQEGKIAFWTSFASDVQLLDRTKQDNVQSEHNPSQGDFYYHELLKKIPKIVEIERSSFNELPVEFPPLFFSFQDKVRFIKRILDEYSL